MLCVLRSSTALSEPAHLSGSPPSGKHIFSPFLLITCWLQGAVAGPQGEVGPLGMQGRWALSRSLSPQSLIVPGKSPTRKKSGPFGSRRSSAIGIENIQEVQEKRWVSGSLIHQST